MSLHFTAANDHTMVSLLSSALSCIGYLMGYLHLVSGLMAIMLRVLGQLQYESGWTAGLDELIDFLLLP